MARIDQIGVFILLVLLLLFYPGDNLTAKKIHNNLYTSNFSLKLDQKKTDDKLIKIDKIYTIVDYAPVLALTAKAVYIYTKDSNIVLYQKNQDLKIYPASLTKILTAITALKFYDLDDVIRVSRDITEGRVMGIVSGQRFTVESLIYGILIHSANDAAYALADGVNFQDFIDQMNNTALELGMQNSHFTNPAGFDDPNHYTTVSDLAKVVNSFLKDPFLKKVVGIKEITISDADFKSFYRLENVNQLLGDIPGVAGLKTGFTPNAGENLVTLYKHPQAGDIVIILVGSSDRFLETRSIINWLNSNLAVSFLN
ncbi:MAG: hypothetical protein KatS3mg090_0230 [Patescibacteria group bacterium]|nr:MAG: hypothetical protein KatS3mg090_0230 [Patescibacteria group bacterium]